MNKVILVARLVRDPEFRTGNTAVCKFTVAVDRRTKDGQTADFPSCVAFGKTAEFISKYFHKGMKIALEGRIQTGSYTNKDGVKVYTTDIVVENAEFAESKSNESNESNEAVTRATDNYWVPIDEQVELPFN